MRNISLLAVGVAFLLSSLIVHCGDDNGPGPTQDNSLAGTWEGTLTYEDEEESPLRIQLTRSGEGYTGSLAEFDEDVWWTFTILNCVATENSISFSIDEKEQVDEPTEYWNFVGEIDGNTMEGEFTSLETESERGTWRVTKQ